MAVRVIGTARGFARSPRNEGSCALKTRNCNPLELLVGYVSSGDLKVFCELAPARDGRHIRRSRQIRSDMGPLVSSQVVAVRRLRACVAGFRPTQGSPCGALSAGEPCPSSPRRSRPRGTPIGICDTPIGVSEIRPSAPCIRKQGFRKTSPTRGHGSHDRQRFGIRRADTRVQCGRKATNRVGTRDVVAHCMCVVRPSAASSCSGHALARTLRSQSTPNHARTRSNKLVQRTRITFVGDFASLAPRAPRSIRTPRIGHVRDDCVSDQLLARRTPLRFGRSLCYAESNIGR